MVSHSLSEQTTTDVRASKPISVQPDLGFLYPDYRVLSKLGEGGFGAVFEVIDRIGRKLALKVQMRTANGPSELKKEFDIYRTLLLHNAHGVDTPGIPRVYGFNEHNGLEYLFMERLGDSLREIKHKVPGGKLSKSDILMVGIQGVRRLRSLHENGILHRDIKPSNLVMGLGPNNEKTVNVIDFGISSIVENWEQHNYDDEVAFGGTVHYAPTEALFHKAPSRKGDLMSLAYTLLFLAYDDLPWVYVNTERSRMLTDTELGVQRIRWKPAQLCEGFPQLIDFFKTISRTKPACEPKYDRLIELLETALEEIGSQNDGNFSWLEAAPEIISFSSECADGDRMSDDEDSFESSFGRFDDGAELVPVQFNFKVKALPWPTPPETGVPVELFDYDARQTRPEGEIVPEQPLVSKEPQSPPVQRRTLIEDFHGPPNFFFPFKMSGISDDRNLDHVLNTDHDAGLCASPGTESKNRESARSSGGIVSEKCESTGPVASLPGSLHNTFGRSAVQKTTIKSCKRLRNEEPRSQHLSRSCPKDVEEQQHPPSDEHDPTNGSSKMMFLILCLLIQFDNRNRRAWTTGDETLKQRQESEACEITSSGARERGKSEDIAELDFHSGPSVEVQPQASDEKETFSATVAPDDNSAGDRRGQSIPDAAAHLYCGDHHECNKRGLVEGEAFDTAETRKDGLSKERRSNFLNKVWSKGFHRAVRGIRNAAEAFARRRRSQS